MNNTINLNGKNYVVVNKIPSRFIVWNIGNNMGSDEYIPICEILSTGICDINVNTLKAIKLDKEDIVILRKAAGYGINSKESALSAIKRLAKSSMQKTQKLLAEKSIDIFQRISD